MIELQDVSRLVKQRRSSMRIIQVHSYDTGGGAEATVRLHHEELRRQGCHSRVYVADKKGPDPDVDPIEYVRGPVGSRRIARWIESRTGRQYVYSPSFRHLLTRLPDEADIVHIHALHGAQGYADLQPLRRLARRVPVVLTINDLWLLTGHCAYPLECTRWLTGCGNCPDLKRYPAIPRDGTRPNWQRKRRTFRDIDVHLVAPAQWVADQVRQSPILGHLPVTVIGNPVDTSIFFPVSQRDARAALRLPQDRRIVLLTAQLLNNVYKGVPDGIEAIKRVGDRNLFLIAIGWDAESVIEKCGVPGLGIPYQSNQSDLADYYRAADVFLMPSRCETFGMVAAEAMACGTPVVAFAAGGLTDVLGDDEGGLLVPNGDVGALVTALKTLFDDDTLRQTLSRSAAERTAREFSLTVHTRRCLELYENVVSRSRK